LVVAAGCENPWAIGAINGPVFLDVFPILGNVILDEFKLVRSRQIPEQLS
jgi:hypothetical protein